MGRPKLDSYWWLFALASAVLGAIGLYKVATYREPGPGDPDWYGSGVDEYNNYLWLFLAVLAGIMAWQLWAKSVSRIHVPKELRKPK